MPEHEKEHETKAINIGVKKTNILADIFLRTVILLCFLEFLEDCFSGLSKIMKVIITPQIVIRIIISQILSPGKILICLLNLKYENKLV